MNEPELGPEPRNVVLLTAEQVAEILQLKSPRSVYKLAARHKWTFERPISARCVRYERRGLLEWIRRRPNRRHNGDVDQDPPEAA